MPARPLISVITPTHNRGGVLAKAIDSVLGQTLPEFEHIIVDDGSTDGTQAMVEALDDPRLIYVQRPWQGANAARNVGILKARAPIITFLDSDDFFLPTRLEKTVPLFDDDRVDLVISSFVTLKKGKRTNSVNRATMLDGPALERALVAQTIFIAGSAITARRQALIEIGCFDPEIVRLQDREMLLRFAQRNGALLSQVVDWQKHNTADSISGSRDGYIGAYDDLIAKNPHIVEKYPDIVPYMVARRILANLMSGEFKQGMLDYKSMRASSSIAYPLARLVASYMRGRRQRKEIRRENRL